MIKLILYINKSGNTWKLDRWQVVKQGFWWASEGR